MRIRYTKSSQAPVLLATAIKLGVSGVTDASTEPEKLAAITKLQDDTASYTNTETNIFLEELANKVLISTLFKRMTFKDPLVAKYFKEGTTVSAAKEIFDNQLLTASPFDKDERYPAAQKRAKILNTILATTKKDYLTNTVMIAGVRAAFASEAGYGEWLTNQVKIMQESLQVIMFRTLTTEITGSFKNVIDLPSAKFDTWDKIFVELTRISVNMKIPTIKYNIGFANPADAKNADLVRTNVLPMEDIVVMGSTDIENAVKGKVSAIKYHNSYFQMSKFNDYISLDTPNTEVFLSDKRAFEGYFRVNQMATQLWAANMSIEYFLHYWFVFGVIPWANGVKVTFTNPDA